VVKENGRRNRYHIQAHLPLPEPTARERTVGEVLALLTGTDATATGKPAAAADSTDPSHGRGGLGAAAEQVRGDLLPAKSSAPPTAMAAAMGKSPRSAATGGRRQGRDRRMGRE